MTSETKNPTVECAVCDWRDEDTSNVCELDNLDEGLSINSHGGGVGAFPIGACPECDSIVYYSEDVQMLRTMESAVETLKRQAADKPATLTQLRIGLWESLNTDMADILKESEPQDRLHEYADQGVPVYNAHLAALLADNPNLAYPDDNIYAGESDVDVFKLLQWTVYEQLSQAAHEWFAELEDVPEWIEETDEILTRPQYDNVIDADGSWTEDFEVTINSALAKGEGLACNFSLADRELIDKRIAELEALSPEDGESVS